MHEEIDQKRPGLNCLKDHINAEIALADAYYSGADFDSAFRHLERAHVLGQSKTFDHTRIHLRMLTIGWKRRDPIEVFGQVIRVVGAATKTAFGIYPKGNTGGSNVYFFKPMPIPEDLQAILDKAQTN